MIESSTLKPLPLFVKIAVVPPDTVTTTSKDDIEVSAGKLASNEKNAKVSSNPLASPLYVVSIGVATVVLTRSL
jgi:hypothetical protein